VKKILELIESANSILLSTHKHCDGDGLGAQLALFHAIKANTDKKVDIINYDRTPKKYKFLKPDDYIRYYEENPHPLDQYDLAMIFDTNDKRLLAELYPEMEQHCQNICFVDHHPVLEAGPQPTAESWIDTSAASTGEMAFQLIKGMNYKLNQDSALALYTSIVFDTQLFRFIRNSAESHRIAAELLGHNLPVDIVHRHLFGNQTVDKVAFLSSCLGNIRYHHFGKIASLKITQATIDRFNLEVDETRDLIDMMMNIETVEAALVFREESEGKYKLSLRSKGLIEIVSLAEKFQGGGHKFAAGASVSGAYEELEDQIVSELKDLLYQAEKKASS
jgi:phosphoesterase RecJ-like protein